MNNLKDGMNRLGFTEQTQMVKFKVKLGNPSDSGGQGIGEGYLLGQAVSIGGILMFAVISKLENGNFIVSSCDQSGYSTMGTIIEPDSSTAIGQLQELEPIKYSG